MFEFDQWLLAGAMPVWIAGAVAALLCFAAVVAFQRAAQPGRSGLLWRGALVVVAVALTWIVVDSLGGRDQTVARRLLDQRAAELTLRAIAPGSSLACLDALANATLEESCAKAVFASPEAAAAAVAYVDARLTLLADNVDRGGRSRGDAAPIERLRRSIEADPFGIVAHVLVTRGCTADNCPSFKLLRDPKRVVANMRERSFDARVIVHAQTWRGEGAPALAAVPPPDAGPPGAAPAAVAAAPATTGAAPASGARFDFPSAASIPAINIMSAEPATPPAPVEAPAATAPARAPAPRRQSAREQAPPPAAAAPVPLPPPGTNPR